MSDPAEMRMFDLGLSKGREIEQERIIKLLEAYPETAWCKADEYCNHNLTCHEVIDWLNNRIDLIKGDRNETN